MSWWRKLVERVLHVEETNPEDGYDRRWRYWPAFAAWNGRVSVGVDLQLVQFEGVPEEPFLVAQRHVQLVYDPRKWEVSQVHEYYDGPHCFYQFGPFGYSQSWGWCKKCRPDQE